MHTNISFIVSNIELKTVYDDRLLHVLFLDTNIINELCLTDRELHTAILHELGHIYNKPVVQPFTKSFVSRNKGIKRIIADQERYKQYRDEKKICCLPIMNTSSLLYTNMIDLCVQSRTKK